jgi:aminopeptidase YwaD
MRKLVTCLFLGATLAAQTYTVRERTVRADMEFLASDALQGRGSTTRDEWIAATYIAAQLRQLGAEPAGDNGTFLQTLAIPVQEVAGPPVLSAGQQQWTHGEHIAVASLGATKVEGPLQKLAPGAAVRKDAIVFVTPRQDKDAPPMREQVLGPLRAGAAAVIVGAAAQLQQRYDATVKQPARYEPGDRTYVFADAVATEQLAALPDGTPIELTASIKDAPTKQTWNVIGKLPGASPEIIMLSAHLDALGIRGAGSDNIVNGADDDASGVTAVLSLARAIAAQPQRRRTVYLALFGSEELGLVGSQRFLEHPVFPLDSTVANLEFEMIGRPDPKVAPKTLWLTGFDRSDLGPALVRRGARLVADPHPQQQFFERSDNFNLAKKGVIAHTVSSYGLHKQYHQPDDDLTHIDFAHMTAAIQSLVKPVLWLVNSPFKPQWNPGKRP